MKGGWKKGEKEGGEVERERKEWMDRMGMREREGGREE